jgi:hypothetical protein
MTDNTPSPLTETITIDDGRMKNHLRLLELRQIGCAMPRAHEAVRHEFSNRRGADA